MNLVRRPSASLSVGSSFALQIISEQRESFVPMRNGVLRGLVHLRKREGEAFRLEDWVPPESDS